MGFIVKGVKSVVKTIGKVVGKVVKVVGGIFGFAIGGRGKEAEPPNTLSKQIDPEAPRKIILGKTAAPLDLRFWEVWGTGGKKYDEVIALATHKVNKIRELYIEDKLAIDSDGIVQADFTGVLSRATALGDAAQAAITNVGSGTLWNASSKFRGVAHILLKWVPDEKKLPNGIPSRYTQIVEGAPVYDPRRDSTVPGGSGTHRINDRSTWEYAPLDANGQPIGRNNALQALWYLLGWTIPTVDATGAVTGEALVAGRGVAPEDINLATFITGANNCETAGYYTDIALSTEDDHVSNENAITGSGLIGRLIDPGGLWSYYANVDDTANIAVELTDADVLDGTAISWEEFKGMSEQFNQVAGKFINPQAPVLYQPYFYPMVRDAAYEANLGKKVRKTLDFRQVLDGVLAQRLARLALNEGQYQGEFKANFNYKAIRAQAYSVVRYTSDRFGWTKLFRVWRHEISSEDGVAMLLKEIHSSIWAAGTVATPIAPSSGSNYDPLTQYSPTGVVVAQYPVTAPDGTKGDGFQLSWDIPPMQVRRTEIRYRLNGTTNWTTAGIAERDIYNIIEAPLFSGAIYDIQLRHISVHEIPGPWVNAGPFTMGTTGNVNHAAIAAAGGTANWSQIVDNDGNKPTDNADVTLANTAAGFVGQKALATEDFADFDTRVTGAEKPANNAGTTLRLVKVAFDATHQGEVRGNYVKKTAGSGTWSFGAYSVEVLANSIRAAARTGTTLDCMWGITDKAPATLADGYYEHIDYGFYLRGTTATIKLPGNSWNNAAVGVAISPSDYLEVVKDGSSVRFFANGVECYPAQQIDPARKFRFYTSMAQTGNIVDNIQFGPAHLLPDVNTNVRDSAASNQMVSRTRLLTELGVADSFKGQKALATKDAVDFRSADIVNKWAYVDHVHANGYLGTSRIAHEGNSADLLTDKWPQEGGANITETRVSDSFKGQKFLATQDFADWTTRVTGASKPADNAGEADNYIRNSSLRLNANHWQLGSFTRVAGSPGDPVPAFLRHGTGSGYANPLHNGSTIIPIEGGGAEFYLSAWTRRSGPQVTHYIGIAWLNANDSAELGFTWYNFDPGAEANVWKHKEFKLPTPPADAAFARVVLHVNAGTNTGTWDIGGVRLSRSQKGSTFGSRLGTGVDGNFYREDGLAKLPQVEVRTPEGIADGFRGQKALATKDVVAYPTDTTGFGKLAGKSNVGGARNLFEDGSFATQVMKPTTDQPDGGGCSRTPFTSGETFYRLKSGLRLDAVGGHHFYWNKPVYSTKGKIAVSLFVRDSQVQGTWGATGYPDRPHSITFGLWRLGWTWGDGNGAWWGGLANTYQIQATAGQGWTRYDFVIETGAAGITVYPQLEVNYYNGSRQVDITGVMITDGDTPSDFASDLSGEPAVYFDSGFLKEAVKGADATNNNYKTGLGISDGFKGQKALATKDAVDFAVPGDWLNRPALINPEFYAHGKPYAQYVTYDTNQSIQDLKPQELGANITENRVSNGFTGQKALATLDYADWQTRVTGAGKPANNAGSNMTWLRRGTATEANVPMQGNYAKVINKLSWGGIVFSLQAFRGTASISARVYGVNNGIIFGLSSPDRRETADYQSMNYGFYVPDNRVFYMESASYVQLTTADFNDVLTVTYNGYQIQYWKNEILLRTVEVAADLVFHPKISFDGNGSEIADVQFGTLADISRSRKFNSAGRVTDPTAYNTQSIIGLANATNLKPTYTDTGTDITISLPEHVRRIAGASGPITLSYGATSASIAYSTYWWAYYDDPDLTGLASPVLNLTTDPTNLLYPGRYKVASGRSPDSGGGGGGTIETAPEGGAIP